MPGVWGCLGAREECGRGRAGGSQLPQLFGSQIPRSCKEFFGFYLPSLGAEVTTQG